MSAAKSRLQRTRLSLGGVAVASLLMAALTPLAQAEPASQSVPVALAATPAKVSAQPTKKKVKPGAKVAVKGKVKPKGAYTVSVLAKRGTTGWTQVAAGSTKPNGAYSLTVPTRWFDTHRFKTVATLDGTTAVESKVAKVKTVPSYKPKGKPKQHKFWASNVRWNPCKPITYKVRAKGGYKGSLKDIKKAFKLVAQATGYTFTYAGSTKVIAYSGPDQDAYDPSTDITVSWATPKQVYGLQGYVAGLGGARYYNPMTPDAEGELAHGGIALDRTTTNLRKGYPKGRMSWGTLMVHEILHAMGLDHVGARTQLMHPYLLGQNHRMGKGDLAGLKKRNATKGCMSPERRRAMRGAEPTLVVFADQVHTSRHTTAHAH